MSDRLDLAEPPKVFRLVAECDDDTGGERWAVYTAEAPVLGGPEYVFTVPWLAKIAEVGTSGLCSFADAAPRVTREMVTGRIGSSPSFHGDNVVLRYCAICGAAVNALGAEGSAIAGIEDYAELHRVWHDRLERLLEQL